MWIEGKGIAMNEVWHFKTVLPGPSILTCSLIVTYFVKTLDHPAWGQSNRTKNVKSSQTSWYWDERIPVHITQYAVAAVGNSNDPGQRITHSMTDITLNLRGSVTWKPWKCGKNSTTARLSCKFQQWYSLFEEWPTGGSTILHRKMNSLFTFMFNKLRD